MSAGYIYHIIVGKSIYIGQAKRKEDKGYARLDDHFREAYYYNDQTGIHPEMKKSLIQNIKIRYFTEETGYGLGKSDFERVKSEFLQDWTPIDGNRKFNDIDFAEIYHTLWYTKFGEYEVKNVSMGGQNSGFGAKSRVKDNTGRKLLLRQDSPETALAKITINQEKLIRYDEIAKDLYDRIFGNDWTSYASKLIVKVFDNLGGDFNDKELRIFHDALRGSFKITQNTNGNWISEKQFKNDAKVLSSLDTKDIEPEDVKNFFLMNWTTYFDNYLFPWMTDQIAKKIQTLIDKKIKKTGQSGNVHISQKYKDKMNDVIYKKIYSEWLRPKKYVMEALIKIAAKDPNANIKLDIKRDIYTQSQLMFGQIAQYVSDAVSTLIVIFSPTGITNSTKHITQISNLKPVNVTALFNINMDGENTKKKGKWLFEGPKPIFETPVPFNEQGYPPGLNGYLRRRGYLLFEYYANKYMKKRKATPMIQQPQYISQGKGKRKKKIAGSDIEKSVNNFNRTKNIINVTVKGYPAFPKILSNGKLGVILAMSIPQRDQLVYRIREQFINAGLNQYVSGFFEYYKQMIAIYRERYLRLPELINIDLTYRHFDKQSNTYVDEPFKGYGFEDQDMLFLYKMKVYNKSDITALTKY